jgi:hypothetical protein
MTRIVWTNFEKQLVSDSMVHFLADQPAMTNKQVFASGQLALPYERRGKVTDQRVFSHKARINEAREIAEKLRADRKKVVAAKPPEPPAEPPARKLDTLGEVFELFIDALADRILDKMIAARQQAEQLEKPLTGNVSDVASNRFDELFGNPMAALNKLTIRPKKRPTALVVGLNGAQIECVKRSRPEVDFTFVTAEQALSHNTFHKDHTLLMTKFINHSVQSKYRKHPNMHYCNGGVSELKTLLHGLFAKVPA